MCIFKIILNNLKRNFTEKIFFENKHQIHIEDKHTPIAKRKALNVAYLLNFKRRYTKIRKL